MHAKRAYPRVLEIMNWIEYRKLTRLVAALVGRLPLFCYAQETRPEPGIRGFNSRYNHNRNNLFPIEIFRKQIKKEHVGSVSCSNLLKKLLNFFF